MRKYKKIDVSEQQLEDIVRQSSDLVEEGLVYVDHQKQAAGGRLDVLLVDSGKSLVIAELKVVEDDGMLMQCLDYYDHIKTRIDTYARLYSKHAIDAAQPVRIILIAPSFSQTLVNRCKWIDAPISLFTYTCLEFEKSEGVTPVFYELSIPSQPEIIVVHKLDEILKYITDPKVKKSVEDFLEDAKKIKQGRISIDAVKNAVSMKVDGRVFAYIFPRRKHYIIATYNSESKWTEYPIQSQDDFNAVYLLVKSSIERLAR